MPSWVYRLADSLVMIDLSAFSIAGMKVTVPNGHIEVRRRADLVTQAWWSRSCTVIYDMI